VLQAGFNVRELLNADYSIAEVTLIHSFVKDVTIVCYTMSGACVKFFHGKYQKFKYSWHHWKFLKENDESVFQFVNTLFWMQKTTLRYEGGYFKIRSSRICTQKCKYLRHHTSYEIFKVRVTVLSHKNLGQLSCWPKMRKYRINFKS